MEFLYSNDRIDKENFSRVLSELFPSLVVFDWDFTGNKPNGFADDNSSHIIYNISFDEHKPEFGYKISIYRTPHLDEEQRALYIGKRLSDELDIKILVPFTHPDSPGNPFYDIVFEKGRTFLVDDC